MKSRKSIGAIFRPNATWTAEVGNAGLGADPRAGEQHDPVGSVDQAGKLFQVFVHDLVPLGRWLSVVAGVASDQRHRGAGDDNERRGVMGEVSASVSDERTVNPEAVELKSPVQTLGRDDAPADSVPARAPTVEAVANRQIVAIANRF